MGYRADNNVIRINALETAKALRFTKIEKWHRLEISGFLVLNWELNAQGNKSFLSGLKFLTCTVDVLYKTFNAFKTSRTNPPVYLEKFIPSRRSTPTKKIVFSIMCLFDSICLLQNISVLFLTVAGYACCLINHVLFVFSCLVLSHDSFQPEMTTLMQPFCIRRWMFNEFWLLSFCMMYQFDTFLKITFLFLEIPANPVWLFAIGKAW